MFLGILKLTESELLLILYIFEFTNINAFFRLDLMGFTNLGLRFMIVTSVFYIALMFFLKIIHARQTERELSPFLGLALFFFFYGIMHFFYEYFDYYYNEYGWEISILYKIAILAAYCGVTGLILFSERVVGKTKFAFTIFNVIGCFYGIFFLHTKNDLQLLTYYTMPFNLIFLVFSWLYLLVIKTKGLIKQKLRSAFLYLLGFITFYLLSIDLVKYNIPLQEGYVTFISYIGSLITLLLLGYVFLSFETFTEFGWKDKMRELYIIAQNGTTIFHYSFVEKKSTTDDLQLVSSGFIGVKNLLMEMMESDNPLKVIDHQDLKVIFEYGRNTILALIAYENLNIFHYKLALLIKQFEDLFQDVLSQWEGDTDVFLPSKQIIENLFY